jgi:O-antigen ligase
MVPIAALCTLLGKALGGISLTVAAFGALFLTRRLGSILLLLALSLIAPLYVTSRTLGLWNGQQFVDFVNQNVSEQRAQSFRTRLQNEDMLMVKALERPICGWGGWGRSAIIDPSGNVLTIPDGMWIIIFGEYGIVGLAAFYLVLIAPIWLIALRPDRALLWTDPRGWIVLAAALTVVLHSIDCIANAMPNPVYYLIAGALASIAVRRSVPAAALKKSNVNVSQPRVTAVSPASPAMR